MRYNIGILIFMLSLTLLGGKSQLAVAVEAPQSSLELAQAQVNVNDATAEQLLVVKGIGPALAERIIAYREENGSFSDPEELMRVTGIGEVKFEQIKPFVRV